MNEVAVSDLDRAGTDRLVVAIPLADVQKIDRALAERWGINYDESKRPLAEMLPMDSTDPAIQAYWDGYEAMADILRDGGTEVERQRADALHYGSLANDRILAPVTSQRRALLIDSIALTAGVLRTANFSGAVLDLGCHAGFCADVLADLAPNEIVGVDPCEPAIAYGRSKLRSGSRVSLDVAAVSGVEAGRFDVVLAIDAMPSGLRDGNEFLVGVGKALRSGGVAILVSMGWVNMDVTRLRAGLKRAGMGYAFADVMGGWMGAPPQFQVEIALVLTKGGSGVVPRDLAKRTESEWEYFKRFANSGTTAWREKTQAFERAYRAKLVRG